MPITKMIEEQSTRTTCKRSRIVSSLIYAESGVQTIQKAANEAAGLAHDGFNVTNVLAGNVAVGPDQNASVIKGQLALASGQDDFIVRPV